MGVLARAIKAVTASAIKKPFAFITTVLVAVVWSIHLFLPFTEPEVSNALQELNDTRDQITENRKQISDNATDFLAGTFTFNEFEHNVKSLRGEIDLLNEKESVQKANYQEIAAAAKISGFPSRHKFIYNFGIGLLLLALYVELLKSIKNYRGLKKTEKKYKAVAYGSIVGFFFAWIFYPDNDLHPTAYKVVLTVLGISISIAALYVAMNHENKIKKLITRFIDFLAEVRNVHFKGLLKTAMEKDLYDETYQEALRSKTKTFQKRVYDEAKEIKGMVDQD